MCIFLKFCVIFIMVIDMNPFKAPMLLLENSTDIEIKTLLRDVYFKYGEYKYALKTLKFDYKRFLDILLFTDTLCTSNLEFQKLSLEDMFYFGYMKDVEKVKLIDNLRRSFLYAYKFSKSSNEYDIDFFNKMNKIILRKTRVSSNEIGKLRKGQAYIMKLGLVGKNIDYIAPAPKDLKLLMKNYIDYLNKSNDDPFIKLGIAHYQFLIIHPYTKGNGRIARMMLPIEFSQFLGEEPILFMSEVFDKNKITYRRVLNESREESSMIFLKFFLKSIIEMCETNINKIEKINEIYEKDFEYVKKEVGGTLINKVYPYILKTTVFSVNEIISALKIHINSANKVLKKLVEVGILTKERRTGCNRVTYRYNKVFDVYINK